MAIKSGGVRLTPREQKAKVLGWTGWSKKEYERQYDRLRNRVRNFERANGLEKGSINAANLLARHAREEYFAKRQGREVNNTTLWTAVNETTSASTGAKLSARTTAKIQTAGLASLDARFAGIREKSMFAEEIQAELEALKKNGEYTFANVQAVYDKYARKLGEARESVGAFNEKVSDPFKRIEWKS